jgi:hypothetical protein
LSETPPLVPVKKDEHALGDEPVDCFARAMACITPQRLEREKRKAKQTGAYLRRYFYYCFAWAGCLHILHSTP